MTAGGLVVGFVPFASFCLESQFHGNPAKLSEAKGSPDALLLNQQSLNVADLSARHCKR